MGNLADNLVEKDTREAKWCGLEYFSCFYRDFVELGIEGELN